MLPVGVQYACFMFSECSIVITSLTSTILANVIVYRLLICTTENHVVLCTYKPINNR